MNTKCESCDAPIWKIPDEKEQKCFICDKPICRLCSSGEICLECSYPDECAKEIKKKISGYKQTDTKRFGRAGTINVATVIRILDSQDGKCYICGEAVLLYNWEPECMLQFSIDRISNNRPHDKGNVKISCKFCNVREYLHLDGKRRVCRRKCHEDKVIENHRREILGRIN